MKTLEDLLKSMHDEAHRIATARMSECDALAQKCISEGMSPTDAANMQLLAARLFLGVVANAAGNTMRHPAEYQERCIKLLRDCANHMIDAFLEDHILEKCERAAAEQLTAGQMPA
jgi:hypothetical protein